METISKNGRTAIVFRVGHGLVGKMPRDMQEGLPGREEFGAEIDNAFVVERKLLSRLGIHPRIVPYYGPCTLEGIKDGLLLGEANCGDLQSYIDKHNAKIDDALRKKWSLQVAQAVAYTHETGVIHSNLGTTNVLVHQTGQNLDLLLANFGGSRCVELNLDGGLLPDNPFSDPCLTDYESPKVDVFSLGVVIYVIMTGHYPFYNGPAPQNAERFVYGERVRMLFEQGHFPNLSDVPFGGIIAGCCCARRFETAKEVVAALEAEMGQ
ncbi:kinase-like protein [Trematosphaeria pertusa]|uniref:Kinase-like protein n=1 Tax=Trematosphaeria pertusa TaxID=390896 RepID=A0A6A6IZ06_9PLEO|nr:kinase-like protein [Trematosphaeria pertusa]KAF2254413.1 kinase-like protein [Trematosphaeria pertusa]